MDKGGNRSDQSVGNGSRCWKSQHTSSHKGMPAFYRFGHVGFIKLLAANARPSALYHKLCKLIALEILNIARENINLYIFYRLN
ncbi:hypothetical protein Bind_2030 [Beijerinckia indica subsp. indica ATCC 9039]|uniref:Uncharacterized protein n=1 Tax=Beijerinckia indica subsp. indica (strain ATCC 9039 / DSM 1715 / NCIMB 8712) TaxID=395963 RepID=B2IF87_BEII9|nr:hypothetical protein Bind_2030 [Beijerinckia indica subsp. indica ATCC 9039]